MSGIRDLSNVPEPVARRLREYYRSRRAHEFLRVALAAGSVYLLLALVVMHLDRFLFLDTDARTLLSRTVHAVGMGYALVLLLLTLCRRTSMARLAYDLESRLPTDVSERYVTLADLSARDDANSSEMHRALLEQLQSETIEHSKSFVAGRLVLDKRFRALCALALCVLSLYLLLLLPRGYQMPLMIQRFFAPGANLPKPSFVQLSVTPDGAVIGKGGEIVLQARAEGAIPNGLKWLFDLIGARSDQCLITVADNAGAETVHAMNRVQRTLFVHSRTDLQNSLHFTIRCGDAQTAGYFVEVVPQPIVTGVRVAVTPPAYTRLPETTFTNTATPLRVYAGSEVRTTFTVDQDVPTRILRVNGEKQVDPAWDENAREGLYAFEFVDNVELDVQVVNDRGFANVDPVRVVLRLKEDQNPVVSLAYPPADFSCVPGEFVSVQLTVEDDLGIEEVLLQYYLNPEIDPDAPPRELPVELAATGETKAVLSTLLDLDKTGAVPGDNLLVRIRARDSGGNDGISRPANIRVTAFARGENERRRLAVLRFAGTALAMSAAGTSRQAAYGSPLIGPEIYAEILKLAEAESIQMSDLPSAMSLLALLEQEHHFTDLPRHKEDLRMLYGLIRDTVTTRTQDDPTTQRRIAENLLPSITAYRRAKNIAWRLYGLGYELAGIMDKMRAAVSRQEILLAQYTTIMTGLLSDAVTATRTDKEVDAILKERIPLETERKNLREELDELRRDMPPGMGSEMGGGGVGESEDMREVREELSLAAEKIEKLNSKAAARVAALLQTAIGKDDKLKDVIPRLATTKELDGILATLCREASSSRSPPEAIARPHAVRIVARSGAGGSRDEVVVARRAALFLKTVEDVGTDLLKLAGSEPSLDRAIFLRQQEALVSSVYLVAGERTSLQKKLRSAAAVQERINDVLKSLAPLLPALAATEFDAREDLRASYATMLSAFARRAGDPGATAEWRASAEAWLKADMRLMGYNPFAPVWPYVRNMHLLSALRKRTALPPEAMAPSAPTIARRRGIERQAFSWELADLLSIERISASEKLLAARLIGLEAAQRLGSPATQLVGELFVEAPETEDIPTGLADVCRLEKGKNALLFLEQSSARGLQGVPDISNTTNIFMNIVEAMPRTTPLLEQTKQALAGGEEDPVEAVNKLLGAVRSDIDAVDELTLLLRLKLAYAPARTSTDVPNVLFLKLRETLGRFRSRSVESLDALEMALVRDEFSAADLKTAEAHIDTLARNHASLLTALTRLGSDLNDRTLAEQETVDKYPLLKKFVYTKDMTDMATALVSTNRPGDVAVRFLERFPDTLPDYLAGRRASLAAVEERLNACAALLDGAQRDIPSYHARLQDALESLGAFRRALAVIPAGETKDKLLGLTGELENRVRALRMKPDTATEREVRQRQFAIGETIKQSEQALRTLDSLSVAVDGDLINFRGGPDNIWTSANRNSANYARRRIQKQSAHARRTVTLSVLSALAELDADQLEASLAWSLFEYRLVRSPLTGPVVTRPPPVSAQDAADPLTRWLLIQLREARQEAGKEGSLMHYRESTLEWIDVMKDFLRY